LFNQNTTTPQYFNSEKWQRKPGMTPQEIVAVNTPINVDTNYHWIVHTVIRRNHPLADAWFLLRQDSSTLNKLPRTMTDHAEEKMA
jgi:hypothetical protein